MMGFHSDHTLIINGRLPSMNQWVNANRTNPYAGNKMKHDAMEHIQLCIREQLHDLRISSPVLLSYEFYEDSMKRDHDNVYSFAAKVIQDALVRCGVLRNDGWHEIIGFDAVFEVDRIHPRIVVRIHEIEV